MKNLLATVFIGLVTAGTAQARPEVTDFLKVLNDCLSDPRSSLAECADVASLIVGSPLPSVYGELDLATGLPTGANNGKVGVCSGGPYNYCDWYDCKEDHENQMSICTFVESTCTLYDRPCPAGPE